MQAGYIQTDDEMLFIEPAPAVREGGRLWEQRPHVIYTCNERDPVGGNYTGKSADPLRKRKINE